MSAGLLALFLFILLALGVADKNWLNTPDKIWSRSPGANISNNVQNEKEIFFDIFSEIGEEVLGHCFSDALDDAEDEQRTLAPSDYLKSDNNYYKHVLKRLWRVYNKNKTLAAAIDMICKAENT